MTQILQGIVEHGDARGRELGFPTANLPIYGRTEFDGIWAAFADIEGHGRFPATVSIGRRPTYHPETAVRLTEVHVLDFAADIYGRHVSVELVSYLRRQERCANDAELVARISADVSATREVLSRAGDYRCLPWVGLVSYE